MEILHVPLFWKEVYINYVVGKISSQVKPEFPLFPVNNNLLSLTNSGNSEPNYCVG